MAKRIDITGHRYGRLVVVERSASPLSGTRWLCRCDCGNTTVVRTKDIRSGKGTKSCGCLARETARGLLQKHGWTGTDTYRVWAGMISRCRENDRAKELYWDRGITVCDRWKSFENFLADMGEKPEGRSIDRIDNDKGYQPGNCRWATMRQQNLNKRNIRYLTFDGKTLCLKDWAREVGVPYGALLARLKTGWSVEQALTRDTRPKPMQSNNTSQVTGVSWDASRRKWLAFIHHKGKFKSLGRYTVKEQAVAARAAGAKKGAGAP